MRLRWARFGHTARLAVLAKPPSKGGKYQFQLRTPVRDDHSSPSKCSEESPVYVSLVCPNDERTHRLIGRMTAFAR
jgi:hypothetical protein